MILSCLTSAAPAAAGYDVSYLWHSQLPSVEAYRTQVAAILGPQVSRDLRIVQKPGLYGLIYYRNGSSEGAQKVARSHSRLLRARGLERAAPMRSRNWNFVGTRSPAPAAQTVAKPETQAPVAKKRLP